MDTTTVVARPIVDAVALTPAEVLLETLCLCSAKPVLGPVYGKPENAQRAVCMLGMGKAHHCRAVYRCACLPPAN